MHKEKPVKTPASLIQGAPGSGKTDILLTYVTEADLDLFIIVTEANGVESLIDSMRRRKADPSKVHWMHIQPSNMDIKALIASADQISRISNSDLQKIDNPGRLEKHKHRQYVTFLEACNNFVDDRTGKNFGPVTDWGPDRALCVDSLTGINKMVTKLQVGNRGTLTLPDYNVTQLAIGDILDTLCGLQCFFTMTAHIEWEKDEVTGRRSLTASTIGQKLAPKIPIEFSEVVKAYRTGKEFWWSTEEEEAALKARSLPMSARIRPGFGQIVKAHKERIALSKPMEMSEQTAA